MNLGNDVHNKKWQYSYYLWGLIIIFILSKITICSSEVMHLINSSDAVNMCFHLSKSNYRLLSLYTFDSTSRCPIRIFDFCTTSATRKRSRRLRGKKKKRGEKIHKKINIDIYYILVKFYDTLKKYL